MSDLIEMETKITVNRRRIYGLYKIKFIKEFIFRNKEIFDNEYTKSLHEEIERQKEKRAKNEHFSTFIYITVALVYFHKIDSIGIMGLSITKIDALLPYALMLLNYFSAKSLHFLLNALALGAISSACTEIQIDKKKRLEGDDRNLGIQIYNLAWNSSETSIIYSKNLRGEQIPASYGLIISLVLVATTPVALVESAVKWFILFYLIKSNWSDLGGVVGILSIFTAIFLLVSHISLIALNFYPFKVKDLRWVERFRQMNEANPHLVERNFQIVQAEMKAEESNTKALIALGYLPRFSSSNSAKS